MDFDGLLITYHLAHSGPFSGGPRWAASSWARLAVLLNWVAYPLDDTVIRHLIGHNFGQLHHHSNKYYWRLTRSVQVVDDQAWLDGYDMMSGGNDFAVSHINPLTKW